MIQNALTVESVLLTILKNRMAKNQISYIFDVLVTIGDYLIFISINSVKVNYEDLLLSQQNHHSDPLLEHYMLYLLFQACRSRILSFTKSVMLLQPCFFFHICSI